MTRPIAMLGAPSSIGIRPYDDGRTRRLDLAPAVLRERDLARRLAARDLGDVVPPPYRDFTRPPDGVRNEAELIDYSRALARRVAEAADGGAAEAADGGVGAADGGAGAADGGAGAADGRPFVLVLGGDCSIVLGCLLGVRGGGEGARGGAPKRVGLAYVDGHADFATPQESVTGSAASMCLGMAVGRGDTPLARLAGEAPLVRGEDVALMGRRDQGQPYGQGALRRSSILDLPYEAVRERGPTESARAALDRLSRPGLDGFWIHLDADVLDAAVMPAVDSPEPDGPGFADLAALIEPLVRHPSALGLQLTIYDPGLDPERTAAAGLAELLERVLAA